MNDTSCYFALWSDLLFQGFLVQFHQSILAIEICFLSMESWMPNQKVLPLCSSVAHFPICLFDPAKVPAKCRRYASAARAWFLKTSGFSNPVFQNVTLVAFGMCGFPSVTEFFPPPTLPQSSKETGATGWWLACCMTGCCVEAVQVREVYWG